MTTTNSWNAIRHITAQSADALVTFGPLRLEVCASYKGHDKRLYAFDEAQTCLARRGLRLPRLRDVMEHVIIPGLEGTLTTEQQPVFDDFFTGDGEWTDNAFYRNQNLLYVSTGINRLVWNGKEYDATNITMNRTPAAYDIGDLPSREVLPLVLIERRAPALVMALCGRPFTDLPRHLQDDGGIILPPEGIVRPTAFAGEHLIFGCGYAWDVSAARGTRGT